MDPLLLPICNDIGDDLLIDPELREELPGLLAVLRDGNPQEVTQEIPKSSYDRPGFSPIVHDARRVLAVL
eukprot:6130636-Lingulodinium_polyedra.AAC.1